MNTNKRISLLQEAQGLIQEAVDLIDEAMRDTCHRLRVDAYLIPALEMAARDDHDWLGGNPCNISSLIGDLREDDQPEPDEDDDYTPDPPASAPDWVCEKISPEVMALQKQRTIIFVKAIRRELGCGLFEAVATQKHIQAWQAVQA